MSSRLIKVKALKHGNQASTGLGFRDQNGNVLIASIEGNSPFFSSFKPDYQVIEVEGVSMAGRTSADAASLVKAADSTVTIVAREHVASLPSFSPLHASKKDGNSGEPETPSGIESPTPNTDQNIEIPVAAAVAVPMARASMEQIATSAPPEPKDEAIQFECPSDLPSGYQLEADINGKTYCAIVPPGGTKQGDLLMAYKKYARPAPLNPEAHPSTGSDAMSQQQIIDVEAPSNLPESHTLEVETNGQTLFVTIPQGGVKMGDILSIPVSPLAEQSPPQMGPVVNIGNTGTDVQDLENPQGFSLTLSRKQKMHQGCHSWKLFANDQEVGRLSNGASLVVRGKVGDKLEVFIGKGCKMRNNTFEMIIKRPGNLTLKLKQTGDITFWFVMVVCFVSLIATAAGTVIGLVPLVIGLAAGSTSIYKYCKAGWREITACDTGNQYLKNGSIEQVTTRAGMCGC